MEQKNIALQFLFVVVQLGQLELFEELHESVRQYPYEAIHE
jgi:hypothetical protein